jgi:signal transduction histidine kinase
VTSAAAAPAQGESGTSWQDAAYAAGWVLYLAGLLLWLGLGLAPSFMTTAMTAAGSAWVTLQYLFSVLNLALGVLLFVRRPHDLVPRLLSVAFIGTAATFNAPSHAVFHAIGSAPLVAAAHFAFHVLSGVAYLWAVILFPDGRLPFSPHRTDAVAPLAIVSTTAIALISYESSFVAHPPFFVAFFGILVPVIGMAAQQVRLVSYPEWDPVRQQARLLRIALAPALLAAILWITGWGWVILSGSRTPGAALLIQGVENSFPAVFAVVPVVLFVGILRYRLWDLDVVVSRGVLIGCLAVFITGVYAAAVVLTGWLFRGQGWSALVAMLVVGLAIDPVRAWLGAVSNRLVFGQRLAPRAAMRSLLQRIATSGSTDELAELAKVVVTGTRCTAAEVWLGVDGMALLVAAAPPERGRGRDPLPRSVEDVGAWRSAVGADVAVPITHAGRALAVLACYLPPGTVLPPQEQRLLTSLAAHAGLLVANAQLTNDLARQIAVVEAQAEDLARSRSQVVAAQDAERHVLERNIHDGAQQELVALLVQLKALQRTGAEGMADESLDDLRETVDASRETLRELCSGGLPPALSAGLPTALRSAAATARRAGLAVEIQCTLTDPLPADVEAAVYFTCVEGLQNASKHATAGTCCVRVERVRVEGGGEEVVFSVTDDGRGFDPMASAAGTGLAALRDRLAALGGTVAAESGRDRGTHLVGRIPLIGDAPPVIVPGLGLLAAAEP